MSCEKQFHHCLRACSRRLEAIFPENNNDDNDVLRPLDYATVCQIWFPSTHEQCKQAYTRCRRQRHQTHKIFVRKR